MLVKQFEQLHKNKKESLILISHQERIIEMADRIMVVRDGKITALDEREKVLPTLVNEDTGCVCMNPEHKA